MYRKVWKFQAEGREWAKTGCTQLKYTTGNTVFPKHRVRNNGEAQYILGTY